MKKIEELLSNDTNEMFLAENEKKSTKENILLYTHTLKVGGAPLVLLEMSNVLREKYNVYVVSPEDGPLKEMFLKSGMVVVLGTNFDEDTKNALAHEVKFIVANTMLALVFVAQFIKYNIPIYWWVHEAAEQYEARVEQKDYYKIIAPRTHLYAAGRWAQKMFYDFCGVKPNVLEFGIEDVYDCAKEKAHEKIRFICLSTVQYRKGKDILMGVIQLLPEEYREKCEFIFLGDKESSNSLFYSELERLTREYECVTLMPLMSKEKLYELYYQIDVVLAPSRDYPTPATIVEGMMYHKINICSDGTGISMYMTDGVDGFVFRNGDILHALEKVMYVIENFEGLSEVRESGRELYENVYSEKVFVKNVWEMVK